MLVTLLLLLILSIAVTDDEKKAMLYSRMVVQGLLLTAYITYNNLFIKYLQKGISLYGGMFSIDTFTQSFNLFLIIIVLIITVLTAFDRISMNEFAIHHDNSDKSVIVSQSSIYNSLYNRHLIPKMNKMIDITYKGELEIIEYSLITVFILCGAILLMSTADLISMFLSIELQSYGLYILATLYRDSEYATNSGLTYFLLGGMSSCFILLGSALLYVNSGTTNLESIYIINSISEISKDTYINLNSNYSIIPYIYLPNYMSISLIVIIVGFLFKISAAPFHFWSPDVYDGIPTIVTTFVAIVPKVSIFIFIVQLVINMQLGITENNVAGLVTYTTLPNSNVLYSYIDKLVLQWKEILIISSLMSLIIGSLLGLTQHRIKRLFAYSTISHVGFILLALSVSTIESIQAYIFYILQYTISNVNSFFILVAIGSSLNKSYLYKDIYDIKDKEYSPLQLIRQLKAYFYRNSYLSISLAITLLSFVGIPPLIGFFAKQMVLSAALDKGYVFITLVGILTSVIGAVYYLNIIKNMFFYTRSDQGRILSYSEYSKYESMYLIEGEENVEEGVEYYDDSKPGKYTTGPHLMYGFVGLVNINSALSATIAILTMIILTFIYIPNEWLRVASILSITLFKL